MKFEHVLLEHLIRDDNYARKVLPFLKKEYFHYKPDQYLYEMIADYIGKYNKLPETAALRIMLSSTKYLDEEIKIMKEVIDGFDTGYKVGEEWLLDETEKFCQSKAIYNGIMSSIQILDGKDKIHTKESIPAILQDALGVTFDNNVGHDFTEDFERRYDFYHKVEEKIPFDIDYFNHITRGGVTRKTLNILLAGTAVGKSLFMCHMAASNLMDGKNVLYITLELSEERVAERIDANLLDTEVDQLISYTREEYGRKMTKLKSKCKGKLIIKEYPTATASSANFRHLLNELRLKKSFVPDIIYIDYLNLALSARIKYGANVNSYTYVKAVAEELRGLAVEFNVAIWSATQTTRSGFTNSDPGLEDTSESFGLPATADFMVALVSTDELASLGQVLVKQLKNRYSAIEKCKRFVVGVDKPKMRVYNLDESAQRDISNEVTPVKPSIAPTFTRPNSKTKLKDFVDFT